MRKLDQNTRERARIHAFKLARERPERERLIGERTDARPLDDTTRVPPITPGALETAAFRAKQRNLCRENIARCKAFKAMSAEERAKALTPVSLATRMKFLKPVPLRVSLLDTAPKFDRVA